MAHRLKAFTRYGLDQLDKADFWLQRWKTTAASDASTDACYARYHERQGLNALAVANGSIGARSEWPLVPWEKNDDVDVLDDYVSHLGSAFEKSLVPGDIVQNAASDRVYILISVKRTTPRDLYVLGTSGARPGGSMWFKL